MAVEKISNRLLVHFPMSKINIFGVKTVCNNIAEIKCCVRLFINEKFACVYLNLAYALSLNKVIFCKT